MCWEEMVVKVGRKKMWRREICWEVEDCRVRHTCSEVSDINLCIGCMMSSIIFFLTKFHLSMPMAPIYLRIRVRSLYLGASVVITHLRTVIVQGWHRLEIGRAKLHYSRSYGVNSCNLTLCVVREGNTRITRGAGGCTARCENWKGKSKQSESIRVSGSFHDIIHVAAGCTR